MWRVPIRFVALASTLVLSLAACDAADRRDPRPTSDATTGSTGNVLSDARPGHATVVRVDARSGAVGPVFSTGPDPLLLAVASGHVWTLNLGDGTLTHVDPSSETATSVDVGEAVGFASDGKDLWVARDGNVLARLDGTTGEEEAAIRPAARRLFALRDAGWLAVAGGSLWLTVPGRGAVLSQTLWRVDPEDGDVLARIALAPDPFPLVADDEYVWVTTAGDQGLTRVDVQSNEAVKVDVDSFPGALTLGDGSVWLVHHAGPQVRRFDGNTLETQAEVTLDEAPRGLSFGSGQLWVATETGLQSIDPATNEVTRTIDLGSYPSDTGPIGIAYLDDAIWISIE